MIYFPAALRLRTRRRLSTPRLALARLRRFFLVRLPIFDAIC